MIAIALSGYVFGVVLFSLLIGWDSYESEESWDSIILLLLSCAFWPVTTLGFFGFKLRQYLEKVK